MSAGVASSRSDLKPQQQPRPQRVGSESRRRRLRVCASAAAASMLAHALHIRDRSTALRWRAALTCPRHVAHCDGAAPVGSVSISMPAQAFADEPGSRHTSATAP